jgi:hypothetical protein
VHQLWCTCPPLTTLQPDRAKRQHPGVCTLHDSGFTFELEHLNRYVLCGLHIMHACKQVYIHTHVHPGANTHLGARGGASHTHNVCVCARARAWVHGCVRACVPPRGWVRARVGAYGLRLDQVRGLQAECTCVSGIQKHSRRIRTSLPVYGVGCIIIIPPNELIRVRLLVTGNSTVRCVPRVKPLRT